MPGFLRRDAIKFGADHLKAASKEQRNITEHAPLLASALIKKGYASLALEQLDEVKLAQMCACQLLWLRRRTVSKDRVCLNHANLGDGPRKKKRNRSACRAEPCAMRHVQAAGGRLFEGWSTHTHKKKEIHVCLGPVNKPLVPETQPMPAMEARPFLS